MALRLIDISLEITVDSVVYPGDEPLQIERISSIGPDCPYNLTKLGWSTHFLTHVDPPKHFVENGASVDQLPLDRFFGEALVIAVDGPSIAPHHLPSKAELRGKRVLFKTDNAKLLDPTTFVEDHVYVTEDAATALSDAQISLIGIDYIDVDKFGDERFPAHQVFLQAGIPILEGLDLSHVEPGRYWLVALPLKIQDGDGSPVRAALISLEDLLREVAVAVEHRGGEDPAQ